MTIPKGKPNETKEEKSHRIAVHAFETRIAKIDQAMLDLKDAIAELRRKQAEKPLDLTYASDASFVADTLAAALLFLKHPDYGEEHGKAVRIKCS